jgi:hypothetical protein
MGFQGSNFEPGIAPESGSLAGPGSFLAEQILKFSLMMEALSADQQT